MSPTAPLSLSVENLQKRYGDVRALTGASFRVAPGEIFGLLGSNGAGKTTCLECILGLRVPDQGRILIGDLEQRTRWTETREWVGAQLQSAALQDAITPREALRLFGSFFREAIDASLLLSRFGLEEKGDAPFASLSGGQKQRLFLALAVVGRPRLLVLDEPGAGLDPQARREMQQLIRGLASEGCTILLSTHDLAEAAQLCERVAILNHGCIVSTDTPAALIRRSGGKRRIRFRAAGPLGAELQQAFPSMVGLTERGGPVVLETEEIERAISEVVSAVRRSGTQLLELQIESPTLEDVFLELTKATYPLSHDKGGAAE